MEPLESIARDVRARVVEMIAAAGSGHPGGSLSAVDLLTALYFAKMRYDPSDPAKPDRDRFILSKGHAAPALYAVLARAGFFPEAILNRLRKFQSLLQGHPDMRFTPGVDMSTGSLGNGLSIANGMALACKLDGHPGRIYVLLGDGEIQEGQIWEAAMSAAHFHLDNLCALLDWNGLQINGPVEKIMSIDPLKEKWEAFGWHTITIDGHDFNRILKALDEAETVRGRPTMILARTVKGKGISFMEGRAVWHGRAPDKENRERALRELGQGL